MPRLWAHWHQLAPYQPQISLQLASINAQSATNLPQISHETSELHQCEISTQNICFWMTVLPFWLFLHSIGRGVIFHVRDLIRAFVARCDIIFPNSGAMRKSKKSLGTQSFYHVSWVLFWVSDPILAQTTSSFWSTSSSSGFGISYSFNDFRARQKNWDNIIAHATNPEGWVVCVQTFHKWLPLSAARYGGCHSAGLLFLTLGLKVSSWLRAHCPM